MEPEPTAPPVVVVVVTCDPGPWFDEALASVAGQDYPNLSVLVVDAASADDPTSRVAETAPSAFVRRLPRRVGFGRGANEVLDIVDGASHYLFCHDDVVLAPDALRVMVEEAFRSNAGIVSPKLLEWDHPEHLLAVGASADRVGVVHPLVERGELDQEQHDGVRDVFVAPGGAMLVRADLFTALRGFDGTIVDHGEDLDFSWRVQLAGARVVVAPAARARHLEASVRGLRAGSGSPAYERRAHALAEQHRVRTVLACYGPLRLLAVIPLLVLYGVGEALWQALRGRPGDAVGTLRVLGGAARNPGRLWRSRRAAQRHRRASDRVLGRLQVGGNARLRAFLRTRVEGGAAVGAFSRGGAHPAGPALASAEAAGLVPGIEDAPGAAATAGGAPSSTGGAPSSAGGVASSAGSAPPFGAPALPVARDASAVTGVLPPMPPEPAAAPVSQGAGWRLPTLAVTAVLVLLVVGSRRLLGATVPSVGSLPSSAGTVGHWWRAWWSTWQATGMGAKGAGPPGLGLLALLGTAGFGAIGTLQHVLVLGPLLLGPMGAYRAAMSWGSRRGRLAAMVVYATVPVPYDALAGGRWDGLVVYAGAPWVLAGISRLSGAVPFPATSLRSGWGRALGVGVLVAVISSVAPAFVFVGVAVGGGLLIGSLLSGSARTGLRCLGVSAAASVAAAALLLPWSASVLTSRAATFGVVPPASGRVGLGELLRFHTGPVGSGALGWALLAAASLPLLIGRSWRLEWAARLWVVALVCVGATWAGLRGWIPVPDPEVLLAPAAAALAAAVGLGAVAFELDLPGYRFGWRQLASGLAAIGVVVASVPAVRAAGGGRWDLPSADASSVLGFLPDSHVGDYRVLWVGAPGALPLRSAFLADGVAYATSFDGLPDATDVWPERAGGSTPVLASDLRLATGRLTTKLGHLLAPLGVRYLVVPNHLGPSGSGAAAVPTPDQLLQGLGQQTDLQSLGAGSDADYAVYVNAAWAPARALLVPSVAAALPPRGARADEVARALERLDLAGSEPVLTNTAAGGRGPVQGPATVYVGSSPSSGWRLKVGGRSLRGTAALGAGEVFAVPPGSRSVATLAPPSDGSARLAQVAELAAWGACLVALTVDRRRRRRGAAEAVVPEWFTPLTPVRLGNSSGTWADGGDGRRGRNGRTGRLRGASRPPAGGTELDSEEVWSDV